MTCPAFVVQVAICSAVSACVQNDPWKMSAQPGVREHKQTCKMNVRCCEGE